MNTTTINSAQLLFWAKKGLEAELSKQEQMRHSVENSCTKSALKLLALLEKNVCELYDMLNCVDEMSKDLTGLGE